MPKKRYTAEEIIHKLREADVLLSQVCREIGVSDQPCVVLGLRVRPHR